MKKNIFVLLLTLLLSLAVSAQQPVSSSAFAPTFTGLELESRLMGRKMPYVVIVPPEYKLNRDTRYPVVYLLHGLGGNYKNWTERTKLSEYAAKHKIIIVTPEGGNGWYTDSATKPNDKYESYIIQELIPEVDKTYRTIAEKRGRAIGGLSMGGYGALKFGVKYPEKFALAASLSGAVSVASWQTTEQIPERLKTFIMPTFGDEKNPVKINNDLFKIFTEMPQDKLASLPFFYLDCGTEDELQLLPFNQQLAAIMLQRKIPHEFRQLPGRHNWVYWNQQVEDILRLSERIFYPQAAAQTAK